LEVVKQRIRDWTDKAAISLRGHADGFTAQTKSRFSQLGAELNKVTGYLEIEALKKQVGEQGLSLQFIGDSIPVPLTYCVFRGENQTHTGGR
jgi:sensitive to high expression protein 9